MHSFPGFCRLRMHTKGGSPVAFVEYQDVRYAAQAMATLQGSLLVSSDRGAIRIEYAKSKMAEVGFTNLWIEVGFTLSTIGLYLPGPQGIYVFNFFFVSILNTFFFIQKASLGTFINHVTQTRG